MARLDWGLTLVRTKPPGSEPPGHASGAGGLRLAAQFVGRTIPVEATQQDAESPAARRRAPTPRGPSGAPFRAREPRSPRWKSQESDRPITRRHQRQRGALPPGDTPALPFGGPRRRVQGPSAGVAGPGKLFGLAGPARALEARPGGKIAFGFGQLMAGHGPRRRALFKSSAEAARGIPCEALLNFWRASHRNLPPLVAVPLAPQDASRSRVGDEV